MKTFVLFIFSLFFIDAHGDSKLSKVAQHQRDAVDQLLYGVHKICTGEALEEGAYSDGPLRRTCIKTAFQAMMEHTPGQNFFSHFCQKAIWKNSEASSKKCLSDGLVEMHRIEQESKGQEFNPDDPESGLTDELLTKLSTKPYPVFTESSSKSGRALFGITESRLRMLNRGCRFYLPGRKSTSTADKRGTPPTEQCIKRFLDGNYQPTHTPDASLILQACGKDLEDPKNNDRLDLQALATHRLRNPARACVRSMIQVLADHSPIGQRKFLKDILNGCGESILLVQPDGKFRRATNDEIERFRPAIPYPEIPVTDQDGKPIMIGREGSMIRDGLEVPVIIAVGGVRAAGDGVGAVLGLLSGQEPQLCYPYSCYRYNLKIWADQGLPSTYQQEVTAASGNPAIVTEFPEPSIGSPSQFGGIRTVPGVSVTHAR